MVPDFSKNGPWSPGSRPFLSLKISKCAKLDVYVEVEYFILSNYCSEEIIWCLWTRNLDFKIIVFIAMQFLRSWFISFIISYFSQLKGFPRIVTLIQVLSGYGLTISAVSERIVIAIVSKISQTPLDKIFGVSACNGKLLQSSTEQLRRHNAQRNDHLVNNCFWFTYHISIRKQLKVLKWSIEIRVKKPFKLQLYIYMLSLSRAQVIISSSQLRSKKTLLLRLTYSVHQW